jgi:hypothetical protein
MDVCCARAPPLTTTPTTALYHLTISAYEGRGFAIDTMDFAAAREKGVGGGGLLRPHDHPCCHPHPATHAASSIPDHTRRYYQPDTRSPPPPERSKEGWGWGTETTWPLRPTPTPRPHAAHLTCHLAVSPCHHLTTATSARSYQGSAGSARGSFGALHKEGGRGGGEMEGGAALPPPPTH